MGKEVIYFPVLLIPKYRINIMGIFLFFTEFLLKGKTS